MLRAGQADAPGGVMVPFCGLNAAASRPVELGRPFWPIQAGVNGSWPRRGPRPARGRAAPPAPRYGRQAIFGASEEHGVVLGQCRQHRNSNLPCSRQLLHLTS